MAAPLYQWRTASCCWQLGGWWLLRRSVPLAAAAGACDGGVRRGMSSAQPSLYDVLGVTPRASSKHIKAAYFRLSKKYHPDRQSGDAVKFQQISAAYEVLGNRQKRRTYDTSRQHGHHGEHAHHHHRHGGARHGPEFHAPRAGDPRAAPHTGRSVHYDYDAWSQAHYKELRWRENKSREDYAIAAEKQRDRREERLRGFVVCAVILMMAAYVGLVADEGFRRDPPLPPVRPPPPPPL